MTGTLTSSIDELTMSISTGEAELDVVAAEPILDLASHPASDAVVGDARVPRDGMVSWHKWSTWDAGKQVWVDASGNGGTRGRACCAPRS